MTGRSVLSLALVDGGVPVIGMVPFASEPDLSAVLVHVSRLAPHGRALTPGTRFAVLIHAPDLPGASPGELARARFSGAAEHLPRGLAPYATARDRYLERFPDSAVTFSLGDFELYRLPLERGRLVAGFARTINLTADSLRRLASGPSTEPSASAGEAT